MHGFHIYRYDPESGAAPHMQSYELRDYVMGIGYQ